MSPELGAGLGSKCFLDPWIGWPGWEGPCRVWGQGCLVSLRRPRKTRGRQRPGLVRQKSPVKASTVMKRKNRADVIMPYTGKMQADKDLGKSPQEGY